MLLDDLCELFDELLSFGLEGGGTKFPGGAQGIEVGGDGEVEDEDFIIWVGLGLGHGMTCLMV